MRKLLRFVGERHTLPVGAILLASFPALLCSQQAEQGAPAGRGGRGPAATYWATKTKGGVYVPPNKPLVKLADLKAKHAGETNWTEIVVKDPENQAEYNSAAPGAKFQPRLHPDTGALFVVVAGDIHFEIENLQPIEATRGSIVNILRTTIYSFEIKGDKPALWVERPIPNVARASAPHGEFGTRAAPSEAPSRLHRFGRPRPTRPFEAGRPRQAGRASRWTGRASVRSTAACRQ
jgi:quercetin dioxygenase-like cupin family protein